MLDGQGYDISCDSVIKVSVGGQVRSTGINTDFLPSPLTLLSSLNP